MERERKSTNEATELLKQQIHLYKSDLDAARQSREETNADNAKLKQKIKDMEDQFHKIRDDFTTERTAHELLAAENSKLKEEIEAYKAELVVEKQTISQLTQDNITLRKQITEKDKRLTQYDENLKADEEKAKEELRKCLYGSDVPQLKKSSDIYLSGYIPPSQQISTLSSFKQSQPFNSNASSGQLAELVRKNQRKQKVDYSVLSASGIRGSSGVRHFPYSSKSRLDEAFKDDFSGQW